MKRASLLRFIHLPGSPTDAPSGRPRAGRRTWRTLASLAAATLLATLAFAPRAVIAQAAGDYPNRPIRLVVPFSAGGTSDVIARLVGTKLGEALGQSVVVENRPGANGNIGSDAVAKAAPDGYTLLLAADGTMAINPTLYPKLPFDPTRDFAAISRVALVPLVFVAHPGVKATTVGDLVKLSKEGDQSLDYSSAGVGSAGHLAGELLKQKTGARMTHLAYKGGGQAIIDVASGQVPVIVTALATAGSFIKAGKLKALGMTSAKRFDGAPDVPTVAESGVAGYDISSWYGVMAPAGTPDPVLDKIHAGLLKVLSAPDVVAKMKELGAMPVTDSRAEFAALIRADIERLGATVKNAGIKLE